MRFNGLSGWNLLERLRWLLVGRLSGWGVRLKIQSGEGSRAPAAVKAGGVRLWPGVLWLSALVCLCGVRIDSACDLCVRSEGDRSSIVLWLYFDWAGSIDIIRSGLEWNYTEKELL
jgi:hypothetical protein